MTIGWVPRHYVGKPFSQSCAADPFTYKLLEESQLTVNVPRRVGRSCEALWHGFRSHHDKF
jgi:hypothetical protein